jgi:hypothetical protein
LNNNNNKTTSQVDATTKDGSEFQSIFGENNKTSTFTG